METLVTDRTSENKDDALSNAINAMGIDCRAAPTGAPSSSGRHERHHGPIRDAFLRILSETPSLAPDMDLSMPYTAPNDDERAHGVSHSTAAMGTTPCLRIWDNGNADATTAGRTRAMQTARDTLERHTAADRLRGALSHPGNIVTYVEVGQEVSFHRERAGWPRRVAQAVDGKTVYVLRDGKIFFCHEARTKSRVVRRPSPATSRPPPAPSAPVAPVRTHTAAPDPPAQVPPSARAYPVERFDLNTHHHARWDEAKRTELATFEKMDCKKTVQISEVPGGTQSFDFVWRVQDKTYRGNEKPNVRVRY